MFSIYVIYSVDFHCFYVGSTGDIERRLKEHNIGKNQSTKKFRPWVLVYKEDFVTKTEARKRENQIKGYKGGRAFHRLIKRAGTEAVKRDRL